MSLSPTPNGSRAASPERPSSVSLAMGDILALRVRLPGSRTPATVPLHGRTTASAAIESIGTKLNLLHVDLSDRTLCLAPSALRPSGHTYAPDSLLRDVPLETQHDVLELWKDPRQARVGVVVWRNDVDGLLENFWHRRYFVLKGPLLLYYKNNMERQAEGIIPIEAYTVTREDSTAHRTVRERGRDLAHRVFGSSQSRDGNNANSTGSIILKKTLGEYFSSNKDWYRFSAETSEQSQRWWSVLKRKGFNADQRKVFGVPLSKVTSRKDCIDFIPRVLYDAVEALRDSQSGALHTEGLFRIPASASLLEYYKEQYNQGLRVVLTGMKPAVIAGLITLYLCELPEPLIPTNLGLDTLEEHEKSNSDGQRIEALVNLFKVLPSRNYHVVKYLFKFLALVAEYQEGNKMDVKNLARIFGMHLIRPPEDDLVSYARNIQTVQDLASTLITHHSFIFERADRLRPTKADSPVRPDSPSEESAPRIRSETDSIVESRASPGSGNVSSRRAIKSAIHSKSNIEKHMRQMSDDSTSTGSGRRMMIGSRNATPNSKSRASPRALSPVGRAVSPPPYATLADGRQSPLTIDRGFMSDDSSSSSSTAFRRSVQPTRSPRHMMALRGSTAGESDPDEMSSPRQYTEGSSDSVSFRAPNDESPRERTLSPHRRRPLTTPPEEATRLAGLARKQRPVSAKSAIPIPPPLPSYDLFAELNSQILVDTFTDVAKDAATSAARRRGQEGRESRRALSPTRRGSSRSARDSAARYKRLMSAFKLEIEQRQALERRLGRVKVQMSEVKMELALETAARQQLESLVVRLSKRLGEVEEQVMGTNSSRAGSDLGDATPAPSEPPDGDTDE